MNDKPVSQEKPKPERRRCFLFLASAEDKDFFETEGDRYRLRLPVEGEDIEEPEPTDGPAEYVLVIRNDNDERMHFRLGVRFSAGDSMALIPPLPDSDAELNKLLLLILRGERAFLIGGEPSYENPSGTGVYSLEELPGPAQ